MPGTCYMDSLDEDDPTYLDEDPAVYEDGPPERRMSSQTTFGGSRVWQDFGVAAADRQIRLRTDWMTQETLDDFRDKFEATATVWLWIDNRGNTYQVIFRTLNPQKIQGHDAYRVEMVLEVVAQV